VEEPEGPSKPELQLHVFQHNYFQHIAVSSTWAIGPLYQRLFVEKATNLFYQSNDWGKTRESLLVTIVASVLIVGLGQSHSSAPEPPSLRADFYSEYLANDDLGY
jgi:hypothetical protein